MILRDGFWVYFCFCCFLALFFTVHELDFWTDQKGCSIGRPFVEFPVLQLPVAQSVCRSCENVSSAKDCCGSVLPLCQSVASHTTALGSILDDCGLIQGSRSLWRVLCTTARVVCCERNYIDLPASWLLSVMPLEHVYCHLFRCTVMHESWRENCRAPVAVSILIHSTKETSHGLALPSLRSEYWK